METFSLPMDELLGKRVFFLDYHSCLLGTTMDRSDNVNGVRTISDLEGIMFNIAAIAEETGKRVRIFFHSLSTLFLYNQPNVVLKFFQITCSRIRSQYGTAIVVVHEGVHDDRTVNHLMAIADGTIELRFDDDLNKMMRIRNMRGYPTSPNWIPFEIKNLSKNEDVRLLEWI
jgi:KaiC/GvpD/RAD55 family RecA-like ATPase